MIVRQLWDDLYQNHPLQSVIKMKVLAVEIAFFIAIFVLKEEGEGSKPHIIEGTKQYLLWNEIESGKSEVGNDKSTTTRIEFLDENAPTLVSSTTPKIIGGWGYSNQFRADQAAVPG